MELLTEAEAKRAIENLYSDLESYSAQFGKRPTYKYVAGAIYTVDIVETFINSVGIQIVGSCIEEARAGINFSDPEFYYDSNNPSIIEKQDNMNEQFETALSELIKELIGSLPEPEPEPEPEPKPTPEELRAEYRTARRQLQSLIRRRQKAGVEMLGISVPKIPKRITQGSINRLLRMSAKVKSEYSYISGRGYKGR